MTLPLQQIEEQEAPKLKTEISLETQVFLSFKHRTPNRYKLLDTLVRANIELNEQLSEKTIYLSEKAKKLYKLIILKLLRGKIVALNHKYLSKMTLCKSDQNWNILKELFKIFDINYHRLFKLNGRFIERIYHVQLHPSIIRELRDTELSNSEFYPEFFRCTNTNRNNFNKVKDIDLESNFSSNSESKIIKSISTPEPVKIYKLTLLKKTRILNQRKKSTKSETKAKVIRFNQYKEPQDLSYHYPLNQEEHAKLQSKSGRYFTLNTMNEILLDMSQRVDRISHSKAQFITYFAKCLIHEKRDAVKTSNDNFYIKVNKTSEELVEHREQDEMHKYLNQVEQDSITNRSDETQFKARIANSFSSRTAYILLKNLSVIRKTEVVLELHLVSCCSLTPSEETRLLWQAQSIGGYAEISKIKFVV
ncbi:MAG: hypothetical protein AB8B66_03860 [Rickettsiaceae bacterium]